jgi:hypothetical protein
MLAERGMKNADVFAFRTWVGANYQAAEVDEHVTQTGVGLRSREPLASAAKERERQHRASTGGGQHPQDGP